MCHQIAKNLHAGWQPLWDLVRSKDRQV
ncbi:hypothetical protein HY229_00915 [Candidatus Acetothermia bacterium]|nr:hypothetical protein [Candidatus Acetothermia bacterium]MBI3642651.1 hypothetical protein [Candidatus Acetothermia bacterium]